MADQPPMKAYMVAAMFGNDQNQPPTGFALNAIIATTPEAAAARIVSEAHVHLGITDVVLGTHVAELTPEFLRAALNGGQPGTVLRMVPAAEPAPAPQEQTPPPLNDEQIAAGMAQLTQRTDFMPEPPAS